MYRSDLSSWLHILKCQRRSNLRLQDSSQTCTLHLSMLWLFDYLCHQGKDYLNPQCKCRYGHWDSLSCRRKHPHHSISLKTTRRRDLSSAMMLPIQEPFRTQTMSQSSYRLTKLVKCQHCQSHCIHMSCRPLYHAKKWPSSQSLCRLMWNLHNRLSYQSASQSQTHIRTWKTWYSASFILSKSRFNQSAHYLDNYLIWIVYRYWSMSERYHLSLRTHLTFQTYRYLKHQDCRSLHYKNVSNNGCTVQDLNNHR